MRFIANHQTAQGLRWRLMRKRTIVAVIGIALVSPWFVVPRIRNARRESAYQKALTPFRRDLSIGMSKDEVKRYLDSRRVAYREVADAIGGYGGPEYEIKIGEDPPNLICGPRDVYIALEFGSSDSLREVHVKKQLGGCL